MKYTFPPEFDKLTPEQINQVNAWLDEFPYRIVHQKLQEHFGIKISDNKLCRYTQNMELADELGDAEHEIDTKDIYALLNGEPVPYDEATLQVIARKTFEHVLARPITVSKLVALHRLATYKQRLDLDQRRVAINEAKFNVSTPERCRQTAASRTNSPAEPASSSNHAQSRQPAPIPPVPLALVANPRPALPPVPPMTNDEWNALLLNPPSNTPRLETTPERYSPPLSAVDRLVASQTIVFANPQLHLLTPQPVAPAPLPKTSAQLVAQLPSGPIPFPAISVHSLRFAA